MLRIALQETRVIVYEELALKMLVAYRHSFWLFWIGLESVLAQHTEVRVTSVHMLQDRRTCVFKEGG